MANPAVLAVSNDPKVAAVKGENTAKLGGGGFGVWGKCDTGHGVHGESTTSRGVVGTSTDFHGVYGHSVNNVGVAGESDHTEAVLGSCHSARHAGVVGTNDKGGPGVVGESVEGLGVQGKSKSGRGLHGFSETGSGVFGECRNGRAVEGWSETNYGVSGDSKTFAGVRGTSVESTGTEGWSTNGTGVFGTSHTGFAVHGKGGRLAGFFEGNVEVTGHMKVMEDISCTNADCAEDFTVSDVAFVEPGTVMVLGEEEVLQPSHQAYDKRVAGVISGAGNYKPGIVLDKQPSRKHRLPVALLGKVFCKVDAQFGAVVVGDLLTTSATPGHAMKADDPIKAFGAVIGKALRPLTDGQGLIPILIALQ